MSNRPTSSPPIGPPGGGDPTKKAMNFGPSLKRLLGRLSPDKPIVVLIFALVTASVVLSSIAPKILGNATNLIFDGIVSKQLQPGTTKEQAVEGLRASGQGQLADMVSGMAVVPGTGIDFDAVGKVLMIVLLLFVCASLFSWLQAYLLNIVVQRTVRRLREDVEQKIHRLPLRYFDTHARGDVLSRVTNDIDNVAQSLQQTLSQLVMSVMTVLGILVMMLWISPLLALIAVATVPLSIMVTAFIAKRSQKHFVAQWKSTGGINAQVEEAFSGHELVKVFGRQQEVEERFRKQNEDLYESSFKAQFISGLVILGRDVPRQPQLRRHRSGGWHARRIRNDDPRRRASVHPVLAAVHPAAHADRVDDQSAAVRRRFGRAGLRAARPRGAVGGPEECEVAHGRQGSRQVRERHLQLQAGTAADRGPVPDCRAGPDGCDRRTHRQQARPPSSTSSCGSTNSIRAESPWTASTSPT